MYIKLKTTYFDEKTIKREGQHTWTVAKGGSFYMNTLYIWIVAKVGSFYMNSVYMHCC